MSIWECINYLVQFFTGRCQRYSFSVKLTFSCVHKFWNLVLCLSVQVLESSQLCVPPFFLSVWRLSLLAIWSSSLIDSNHGEELWVITFRRKGGACLSSTVCTKSQNWFAFSTDENSETLECSAIIDGRSMLAMFLTVLYKVEGLETETLKYDLVQ